MIDTITKTITVQYKSLEELFDREKEITKTLLNNLKREDIYKFIGSTITNKGGDKWTLNLEIMKK